MESQESSPIQEQTEGNQDWHWQVQHSVTTLDKLEKVIHIDTEEREAIKRVSGVFPFRITPYYAQLMEPNNPQDPIRQQVIPDIREVEELEKQAQNEGVALEELLSRLAHEGRVGGWDNPEDFIDREKSVEQKYPNRVAWLITRTCPAFCRHCVRKVMSEDTIVPQLSQEKVNSAIEAIQEKQEVNDVLITGGDAFMIPNQTIDEVLTRLLDTDHISTVRFGTRTPVTLPQRITSDPELLQILEKHAEQAQEKGKVIWVMTQFNHPKEITDESRQALGLLRKTGCELGNQSVLLKGVNDDIETLEKLFHQLATLGVRPYYLYQGIPTPGSNFRYPPISKGLEIMRQMYERQNLSGHEKPRYILADSQVGKIPIPPPGVSYELFDTEEEGHTIETFRFPWKGEKIEYKCSKE